MQDLEKEYPVVIEQPLIWGDMDAYQHVNNTVYFRYFEDVRILRGREEILHRH